MSKFQVRTPKTEWGTAIFVISRRFGQPSLYTKQDGCGRRKHTKTGMLKVCIAIVIIDIKDNYPYLGRGRSLNFRFLFFGLSGCTDFQSCTCCWTLRTASTAAGPFERLSQNVKTSAMFCNFNAGGGD